MGSSGGGGFSSPSGGGHFVGSSERHAPAGHMGAAARAAYGARGEAGSTGPRGDVPRAARGGTSTTGRVEAVRGPQESAAASAANHAVTRDPSAGGGRRNEELGVPPFSRPRDGRPSVGEAVARTGSTPRPGTINFPNNYYGYYGGYYYPYGFGGLGYLGGYFSAPYDPSYRGFLGVGR